MRETRLSGSEGGGILSDSPYPYSDFGAEIDGPIQGRQY